MLALTGWSLSSAVETRADIATLHASLSQGLTPRITALENDVGALQSNLITSRPFGKSDADRMEERIDSRLDRIQQRISSLEDRLSSGRSLSAPPSYVPEQYENGGYGGR